MTKFKTAILAGALASLAPALHAGDNLSSDRIGLFSLSYVLNSHDTSAGQHFLGFELLSYQHVFATGWGIKVVPLNYFHWEARPHSRALPFFPFSEEVIEKDTINYVPVWLRHTTRTSVGNLFLGVGPGFHDYRGADPSDQNDPEIRHTGLVVAGEAGIEVGSKAVPNSVLSVKVFPGWTGNGDETIAYLEYGLQFGWTAP